jgi:epoxyqueuosine reductase
MAGETDPATWILEQCNTEGFALSGVCDALPPIRGQNFRDWLDADKHGEMAYLSDHFEASQNPDLILKGAKSVVMVADLYATRDGAGDQAEPGFGRIARYARGRDYHKEIKKRLHKICDDCQQRWPDESFRTFVDTVPINERDMASRAGLGWIAKHTLLINPKLGSWMLLGGFLTTLKLETPTSQAVHEDHCGTCTRCIDACPTDAITPYSVDGSKCISYLTIEHRSAIDEQLAGKMQDWIGGCDICQEFCPHNSPKAATIHEPNPAYSPTQTGFDLLEVLGWDTEARQESLRSNALKRIKLDQFRRNAAIAAGNALREQEIPELLARLELIVSDETEPELVRQAARWALACHRDL